MGSNLFNRVKFTATSGTTANFAVSAAVTGYDTPATRGVTGGSSISYTAESADKSQWETGFGTYLSSSTTISRDKIRESSNSGSAVAFSSAPFVWLDAHAQDLNRTTVFNVKAYGAKGDGSTDDTSAINNAIAAFNSAGAGQLYFPSGTYKVTSSLTTITGTGLVAGDGRSEGTLNSGSNLGATLITYTDNSTPCFTVNGTVLKFQDMGIQFTGVSTPIAGSAGILVTSSTNSAQSVDYLYLYVFSFYIDIDIQVAQQWTMDGCSIGGAVFADVRTHNNLNVDAGGWCIANCLFGCAAAGTTYALRILGPGDAKITNCKIIGTNGVSFFGTGIYADFTGTGDLLISNCSIENTNLPASVNNTQNLTITGCQFDQIVNGGTDAIQLVNCSNVAIVGNFIGGKLNADSTSVATMTTIGNSPILQYSNQLPDYEFIALQPGGSVTALQWSPPLANPNGALQLRQSGGFNPVVVRLMIFNGTIGPQIATIPFTPDASFSGGGQMFLVSDGQVSSGGSDAVIVQAGGTSTGQEVVRFLAAGNMQFTNTANFTANTTSTATSLSSGSPGHTTVQKWLTILGSTGNNLYIPCF